MSLVEYKQYEGITFFAIPKPLEPRPVFGHAHLESIRK